MAKGKVKWFNDHKGYGFIEQNEGDDVSFIFLSSTWMASKHFKKVWRLNLNAYQEKRDYKQPKL